jgi:hypothetical protein
MRQGIHRDRVYRINWQMQTANTEDDDEEDEIDKKKFNTLTSSRQ